MDEGTIRNAEVQKYSFIQDEEGGDWELIEPDSSATSYTAFKQGQNPFRMRIFHVRPPGTAYHAFEPSTAVAFMATKNTKERDRAG
jgi:hypothetical protein